MFPLGNRLVAKLSESSWFWAAPRWWHEEASLSRVWYYGVRSASKLTSAHRRIHKCIQCIYMEMTVHKKISWGCFIFQPINSTPPHSWKEEDIWLAADNSGCKKCISVLNHVWCLKRRKHKKQWSSQRQAVCKCRFDSLSIKVLIANYF